MGARYRGVCVLCDGLMLGQSLVVETVAGLAHEACALQLEQRADAEVER